MHRDIKLHDDKVSLDWFKDTKAHLSKGLHEFEANQFAAEYLMPSQLFYDEAKGRQFSPELLRYLIDRFCVSYTAAAFKYFEADLYPMAMFHIFNGEVKYWKKSEDMHGRVKDITSLPPPRDSVANEYIIANYAPIYEQKELMQPIFKSVWFDLDDSIDDTECFEYCIVSQSHKSILSIIWEP
jgi:Zn-dependent peptidase ImmA (M78 family)